MFPFKYDRYSSAPITDAVQQIDVKKLQLNDILKNRIKTVDELFDEYILSIEQQRGYKCSRQERRKLYKNFIKRNKK